MCSGIEAASVAWGPLGWKAAWFAEIEPFPSAVLAHHYPEVKNYGDMTLLPQKVLDFEVDAPDILCGGTPCQAFSVAGKRESLSDERLQGFPDGYTRIPNWSGWRAMDADETPDECTEQGLRVKQNKKTGRWSVNDVDGPRYKALGNSWAVPNVRWIGQRIDAAVLT